MQGVDDQATLTDLTSAFKDMRWVELTGIQHLIGAVVAIVWTKATGKMIWPSDASGHRMLIYVICLSNVLGNMATNAAFSLVTPSTVQVVRASEPLLVFAFSLLLCRTSPFSEISKLSSVVIIALGAGAFLMKDESTNFWGVVVALLSNFAIVTRNSFLKELGEVWEGPSQKFAILSIYSTIFVLPLWLVKVLIAGWLHSVTFDASWSGVSHSLYKAASIFVYDYVDTVTHVVLGTSKRLFIITASSFYFNSPFSLAMILSLFVLALGCYFYHLKNTSTTRLMFFKCLLTTLFFTYMFSPIPTIVQDMTMREVEVKIELNIGGDKVDEVINVSVPSTKREKTVSTCSMGRISTAWLFDQEIPKDVLTNIKFLADSHPELPLYVYCGTTQCVHAVGKVKDHHDNIYVEFAVVSDILEDTPLEQWAADHSFNKILAGRDFEIHVQQTVKLGLLLKYGGIYVNPLASLKEKLVCENDPLVSRGIAKFDERYEDGIAVAYFPKNHTFIRQLAENYAINYPKEGKTGVRFQFSFADQVLHAMNNCSSHCPKVSSALELSSNSRKVERHYGTFVFSIQVQIMRGANYGDEMQGFPGVQYYPYVDCFVERENLAEVMTRMPSLFRC